LVTRGTGDDGRSRSVVLTGAGKRVAQQVTVARAALLSSVLDELSPAERETLHALMSRIMASVVGSKEGGAWICRLCDLDACGRASGHCPAASAAAAKYANP
jgi:rubrerythrin